MTDDDACHQADDSGSEPQPCRAGAVYTRNFPVRGVGAFGAVITEPVIDAAPRRARAERKLLTMPHSPSAPGKTRILLADDHALVRRGVRLIPDGEPDLQVVAEAGDGAEAIEMARAERPDLAVLDIAMPRLTVLQAARELSRVMPELRILMLTMYDNEQ